MIDLLFLEFFPHPFKMVENNNKLKGNTVKKLHENAKMVENIFEKLFYLNIF